MIGTTTCRTDCQPLAPKSRAASSQAGLKRLNTPSMIKRPNGIVQVRCAPKAELYQDRSSPSISNIAPMPRLTTTDGITRLATVR